MGFYGREFLWGFLVSFNCFGQMERVRITQQKSTENMNRKLGPNRHQIVATISAIAGTATVLFGFIRSFQDWRRPQLDGWWEFVTTVNSTSYTPYRNMQLGYRILLQQNGDTVTGKGEKIWEKLDGKERQSTVHTPITLNGDIAGDTFKATVEEEGKLRRTTGSVRLTLSADARSLTGVFQSTAAASSGSCIATFISSP